MDQRPIMVTTEVTPKLPVLIVDKKGFIGKGLARLLREQFLIVLVTGDEVERHENVIHIPYSRKIPMIPDNDYSQIIVAYNGELEIQDMLPVFVQKAQESKSKLLFVTSLLTSTSALFTQLNKVTYPLFHIIMYGETFANRNTENNEINYMLHQVRVYGRVEVPNAGIGKLYPILYDDVLMGIVKVALSEQQPARLLFAFPHYPFTQISIVRILQKHDPLLKVDFKKKKSRTTDYYIPAGGISLFPEYNLESRLRQLDLKHTVDIRVLPQEKIKLNLPDPDKKRRRVSILLALICSILLMPILLTFLFAISGAGFLSLSLKQAEQGKIQEAQQLASFASVSFAATEELIPGLVLPTLFVPNQTKQFLENIQTGREVVQTEQETLQAIQLLKNIYGNKSTDPKGDFLKSLATLKNTLLTLQKLKAENKLPQAVEQKLEHYTGVLRLVEGTVDTWPVLFGFEGKKTYLVLFQNNMELRPGGGFIGSYGILPVQNGKFEKLQVHDVYDADGQLKTDVEPPYALQRYVGMSHWFLRDSNFDADFSRDAVQAVQFLRLETGQNVDGVIAIDTTFLKNVLTVLGSVDLPDYHLRVTPENFYLLTQTHVEKGFFPGSTQKKDFLRSLTNAMEQKLFAERNFSYEKLLQQMEETIRQKHLLFSFSDGGVQNVFTVNGLSSSLLDLREKGKNTMLDFLSVIDANIGSNKGNYYVRRSISQDVAIDGAGGLQTTAQVVYTNTSKKDSPFGGDYKDYVRFLLPASANLQSIVFDGVPQETLPAVLNPEIFKDPAFVPPTGLEIEQTVVLGKKSIGFYVIVPVGKTKAVAVTYTLPQTLDLSQSAFSYNLRLFKQPGTLEDPYALTFSYPPTFKIINKESGITDLGGKFRYETTLSQDKDFVVSFSRR